MAKAKQIEIPVLLSLETNNSIIYQRERVFLVDRTDEITQALQAVAQRSGKPVAEVIKQFALETVKDQIAKDNELQKIVKDFKNKMKAKVRLDVTLNSSINW